MPAKSHAMAKLTPYFCLSWLLLAVTLAAAFFPQHFGLLRRSAISDIRHAAGNCWQADIPAATNQSPFNATRALSSMAFSCWQPQATENGQPLPYPNPAYIKTDDYHFGCYSIEDSKLYFSSSDNTPPPTNHKKYEVVTSAFQPPAWLLIAILAALLLNTRILYASPRLGESRLFSKMPSFGAILPLGILAYLGVALPGHNSTDNYFAASSSLVLWSLGFAWSTGLASPWPRRVIAIGYMAFLLLVTWIYFNIELHTDTWRFIGGIIPWSDEKQYFSQAAGIAAFGGTGNNFNGRAIYPVFLSSLMQLSGFNLRVAILLDTAFVLGTLYFAARAVCRRAGKAAGFVFSLLIACFIQAHCNGFVMSENLGLIMGLIGVTFVLRTTASSRDKRPYFSLAAISLGNAVRPGAIFAAIGPIAGLLANTWRENPAHRLRRLAIAALIACVVFAASFFSNNAVKGIVFSRPGMAFGNFTFSFYGLVTNTDWGEGAKAFSTDYKKGWALIRQSVAQHPELLLAGINRAYHLMFIKMGAYTLPKFHSWAPIFSALACMGLIGALFLQRFRVERISLLFAFIGFLASVPLIPYWDAGLRPYAVYFPWLAVFVAYGANILATFAVPNPTPIDDRSPNLALQEFIPSFVTLAAIVVPLLLSPFSRAASLTAKKQPFPLFKNGSHITLASPGSKEAVSVEEFLKKTVLFAGRIAGHRYFTYLQPGCTFGIDWSRPPRRVVLCKNPTSKSSYTIIDEVQVQNDLILPKARPAR